MGAPGSCRSVAPEPVSHGDPVVTNIPGKIADEEVASRRYFTVRGTAAVLTTTATDAAALSPFMIALTVSSKILPASLHPAATRVRSQAARPFFLLLLRRDNLNDLKRYFDAARAEGLLR